MMLLPAVVHAQPDAAGPDKTLLEIDLVLPAGPSNPLLAQKWRQEFESIGELVRIRQFIAEDKPSVTQSARGPFRVVKLVGMIDLEGQLNFPKRSFMTGQGAELGNWLKEIKTFGAQGSPSGKPLWGLTEAQYTEVRQELSSPTTTPVRGLTLQAAINALPLPESLPLSPHSSVREAWERALPSKLDDEVLGLSAGTSLAFLLSQQGLGFRPIRQPNGEIHLLVQSLREISDPWPVGWPEVEGKPRNELVPGLFGYVEIGVQEAPLVTVLDAIEERADVRILLDRVSCLAKGLDPTQLLVSYPKKKRTAWSLILSSIVTNSHMKMNYRQDEAGTGFIWIVPFAHYRAPKPSDK